MRKLLVATAALALGACLADSTPTSVSEPGSIAPALAPTGSKGPRPGHYVVVFAAGVSDPAGLARGLVNAHGGTLEQTYRHAIKGFAAELSQGAVTALRRHPDIALIEEDAYMAAEVTQTGATWGLDRIDQRDLPLSSTYSYTATGAGVHAYIIDSGIKTTLPEFGGRASSVFNTIADGNGSIDCNGHGTHVAGTVGSNSYGVAKQVSLYAVRVLDCEGNGTTSDVIAGVDWVTANHLSPAVANMSIGGPPSSALDQAVRNLVASGVTITLSAGNSDIDACQRSPARTAEALTIGATTLGDARAYFSNWGTCVDLFAPGEFILSTWNGGTFNMATPTDTLTTGGTSMAAPHVAGVAARYLQLNPTATPAQIATALISNATLNRISNPGSGSPNRLLYSAFVDAPPPPVNQPPVAAFTFGCTSLTCSFDSSGSTDDVDITSRAWTFGDGATAGNVVSPSRTYAAAGSYDVTLTVTDGGGLTSSITKQVTVTAPPPNQPPVARFTYSCVVFTCTLDGRISSDDVGIVSYAWNLGRFPNPTASGPVVTAEYPHEGPRTVTLTVTDAVGATNSVTQTFMVGENLPPVAAFTFSCTSLTCSFNSSGSSDDFGIASRAWTFGDGGTAGNVVSPSRTYAAGGTYGVTLTITDNGGLTSPITKQVTVTAPPPNQAPVAAFTFSCTNLACSFNSSGSTDDVGITNRSWTFGDGATAGNVVSPSRTYAAGGTYGVTLTVTDGGGLTSSVTQQVTVTPPNQAPVAAFSFTCTNLACSFDSSGSSDDVGVTSRSWTFGDGATAGNVVSPSRTYAAGGSYDVTLTVTDGGGLTSSITKQVTVTPPNQPPAAAFTFSCTYLACSFNSTGSSDDVGITSRAWTFGDGATAGNVVSPSRTYGGAGTYDVTLTVTDGGGLTSSITKQVTATEPPPNQPPVAAFTSSCTNLACSFDSSGSSDDVGITSRAWTFGDGATAGNVVSPSRTYAAGGTYSVTLTVTDGGGLTSSVTQQVTVTPPNQAPVAAFTSSCTNLACSFDSSGSTDDAGITNRAWTFGDGATAGNVVSPSRTYAAGGTYNVTLTVTDAGGLTNAITKQVTVTPPNQPPVAAFTFTCTYLACSFNSTGSSDDVGITSRAWTFGDGATAGNVVSPNRTYAAGGTYSVTLTVTDAGGLTSSITKVITVAPNQAPVARFTVSCSGVNCTLDGRTSTDDVGIVSYAWNLGRFPNPTATGAVVNVAYAHGGPRTVTLTVTDGAGLTNSTTLTFLVPEE